MLHQSIKLELVAGLSYLLIGLISLGIVLTYSPAAGPGQTIGLWTITAIVLAITRFIIIQARQWFRRDQWRSVSRRRW
ncbi:MAG: hypothetical protein ACKOB4_13465 [Acidobacteriota bacterium]